VHREIHVPECPIVLTGGLSRESGFRKTLVQSLTNAGIEGPVIAPKLSAAGGAVLLALKSANIQIDESFIRALQDKRV
jgi:hypothetical protein